MRREESVDWPAELKICPEGEKLWFNLPSDYSREYGYHYPIPFVQPLKTPLEVQAIRALHNYATEDPKVKGRTFSWAVRERGEGEIGKIPDFVLTRRPLAGKEAYLALSPKERIAHFCADIGNFTCSTRTRTTTFVVTPQSKTPA